MGSQQSFFRAAILSFFVALAALLAYAYLGRGGRDEAAWATATKQGTELAYREYLKEWPDGIHEQEANGYLDDFQWELAKTANTMPAVQAYLTSYPRGKHLDGAKSLQKKLLADRSYFEAALKKGSRAAIAEFLRDYPGHACTKEAQEELQEFRGEIADLIAARKIEVRVQGGGITNMHVEVRAIDAPEIEVEISVGTFFVSQNPHAQNMVATDQRACVATRNEWVSVNVPVACCNRPRSIPKESDEFSIQPSPHQNELRRLMPVLQKSSSDSSVRQAAVWIITDNADYADLGILVVGFGFGGSRVINQHDAAQAMRICQQAGIDIRRKAIWNDREKIFADVKDADLVRWLRELSRQELLPPIEATPPESREAILARQRAAEESNARQAEAYAREEKERLAREAKAAAVKIMREAALAQKVEEAAAAKLAQEAAAREAARKKYQITETRNEGARHLFRVRLASDQATTLTPDELSELATRIADRKKSFIVRFYLPAGDMRKGPWAISTGGSGRNTETKMQEGEK